MTSANVKLVLAFAIVLFVILVFVILQLNGQKGIKSWTGLHVVVAGGSSGLGLELACAVARRSCGAVTVIARDQTRLKQAVKKIEQAGGDNGVRVSAVSADLTEPNDVIAALDEAERKAGGPINVLVHCAGGARPGYTFDLDDDIFHRQMQLNYMSLVYVVREVARRMITKRIPGYIVTANSMGGLLGTFGYAAYTPAKMAARGFMECIYYDLHPHGIRSSILYAPDMATPGFAEEGRTKPPETRETTETATVFDPKQVAESTMRGLESGRRLIFHGFEGLLLVSLCSGGSPHATLFEFLAMSILRLVMQCYILTWSNVITRSIRRSANLRSS